MKRIIFGPWVCLDYYIGKRPIYTRKTVGKPRLLLPDFDSHPVTVGFPIIEPVSNWDDSLDDFYVYQGARDIKNDKWAEGCVFSRDLEWLKEYADEQTMHGWYGVYGCNEDHKVILLTQEEYEKYMVLV